MKRKGAMGKKKEVQMMSIQFLQPLSLRLQGKNGGIYGPYKRGDIAKVEKIIARLLISKGYAKG